MTNLQHYIPTLDRKRKLLGLSQREVSKRAGITEQTYSRIIKVQDCFLSTLCAIEKVLADAEKKVSE